MSLELMRQEWQQAHLEKRGVGQHKVICAVGGGNMLQISQRLAHLGYLCTDQQPF